MKKEIKMRKELKAKSYVYPLPVLIIGTYDENGNPNAMNAAWGTVCDTAQVSIVLSASHKTVKNFLKTKAFTVAMADEKNVVPADFVGVVSANNTPSKLEKTGWTIVKSDKVNAPIFDELPLVLECKLISYDFDTEICIGEVVGVSAKEEILDANCKVDLTKFKPICYDCDTHGYYTLGNKVGQAFSDGLSLK
jgi:flavin reductase (DIM6/NTAB) family NADH-FMN oxidoreductase RutF